MLLSDWADIEAEALFARLKKMSDYDNFHQRTLGDFVRDAREDGLAAALADRRLWGRMRMTPTDLSDVNAHTYTYLMNGVPPAGNWTGLFRPGERLRLRLINASAMSYFDVRIPGLKMTVVAVDGQNVHPVTVDELRIADAETFDVIVTPTGAEAFTIFAQDMGRTGFACGFLLFDRLEWRDADGSGALSWDVNGWLGRDTERLWLRAEGEREGGRTEHAEAHLLYGRAFAPWWEVVAGVRQDFRPGPAQAWAAVGVQGLAPYGFEVEAGIYLGEAGRTAARVEVEYELLFTNRLILQPRVELNAYGRDDERRDAGAGLSEIEAGLRLRYELRREFAPYVGVTWGRRSGASAAGEGDARVVIGARFWF